MPNGGEHYVDAGLCPHCNSPRIRIRRGRHREMLWRCRSCNKVFRTPSVGRLHFQGQEPNFISPSQIRSLESRARRRGGIRTRRNGSKLVICTVVVLVILAVAGGVFWWLNQSSGTASSDARQNGVISALAPNLRHIEEKQNGVISALTPDLRHIEEKRYMLELINGERAKAGLNSVVLGDNIAAQLHAESGLENCFASHWGIDGLKPYMRYSLAGGYEANGENAHGLDYCITASDGIRANGSIEEEIREAMAGWMSSPGHRRNILDPQHKRVNIGLAWDRYNAKMFQHFEGDYVEYDGLPAIANGVLSLSGKARNGVRFSQRQDLGVQIYYDPPPHTLTPGQVARTYCYDDGRQVAGLRELLTGGSRWSTSTFTTTHDPCPSPYDVATDAPAPRSPSEADEAWQQAYDASQSLQSQSITVPWITASEWTATGTTFLVKADISQILNRHGDGVYTLTVWGKLGGEDVVISEYSIFHGVTPPDTYNPDAR